MIKSFSIIACAILMVFVYQTGFAQSDVISSGGEASGDGSASYSVGQIHYNFITDGSSNITEGLQQAYEISEVTEVQEFNFPNISISVFPNPTKDLIHIQTEEDQCKTLQYQLYDLNGKLLLNGQLNDNQQGINMSDLPPASYYLKISNNTSLLKTFKIIKH